jgi:hypothetical protein
LRLALSDSGLVDVLMERLRDLQYSVDRVGADVIEIDVRERRGEGNPPEQERTELVFLVRACLIDHPDAQFHVLD